MKELNKHQKEKSKAFIKFEHDFFCEADLTKPLSHIIDIWTIDGLSKEEKIEAEKMLIDALSSKIDKRWLYGLEELATETAYNFLLNLFNKEKNNFIKTKLSYSLIRINSEAPIMDFLEEMLISDEHENLKMSALSSFYWLKDHQFKEEEKNDLYSAILFNSMLDKNKRVREYSYEILREYFNITKFTPKNDSVKDILSKQTTKVEYKRAVEIFKERINSRETTSFSKKAVIQFIKELLSKQKSIPLEKCDICSQIPERSYADLEEGESLDLYKSKLDKAIIFAYYDDSIMRCPVCGRLYYYDYHYQYFANTQNDEEETLTRIDLQQAIDKASVKIKSYKFKTITKIDVFMLIDY